jgi:hypothetical protein
MDSGEWGMVGMVCVVAGFFIAAVTGAPEVVGWLLDGALAACALRSAL